MPCLNEPRCSRSRRISASGSVTAPERATHYALRFLRRGASVSTTDVVLRLRAFATEMNRPVCASRPIFRAARGFLTSFVSASRITLARGVAFRAYRGLP